ncbi:MAG TPA: DUF3224 domain-containing protein [Pilimelia sp.]|nr:DUF3224 domain-containing protein [Pilimelia sp.]
MGTRATSTFTIDSWHEENYDENEGATLSRTTVTKTFTGDLVGTSSAELLMARGRVEGSAAYVGFERISGRLHDRDGGFVLHHTATGSAGEQSASWTVVPDTGTGDLTGIRGSATITVAPDGGHTFVLDYTVE